MEPIQLRAMRSLKRLRPLVDGLSSTHVAARQPLVAVGRCAARVWLVVDAKPWPTGGEFLADCFLFYRPRWRANESSGARVEISSKTRRLSSFFGIQLRGHINARRGSVSAQKHRQYAISIDLERWCKAGWLAFALSCHKHIIWQDAQRRRREPGG